MTTSRQAFTRTVSISPRGLLVLPQVAREALGLTGKGQVRADVRKEGVALRRAVDGENELRVSRNGVIALPAAALGGWISSGKVAYTVSDQEVVLHRK